MDELTMLVKSEIKRKYKSVRKFSEVIGIPQSTLISALKNGIGGTSFDTVIKICAVLGIKLPIHVTTPLDKDRSELLEYFAELDDRGKYTVKAVCNVELLRCRNVPVANVVAALEKMQSSYNE